MRAHEIKKSIMNEQVGFTNWRTQPIGLKPPRWSAPWHRAEIDKDPSLPPKYEVVPWPPAPNQGFDDTWHRLRDRGPGTSDLGNRSWAAAGSPSPAGDNFVSTSLGSPAARISTPAPAAAPAPVSGTSAPALAASPASRSVTAPAPAAPAPTVSASRSVTAPAYTGTDPIVRQRLGMPPATADEIKSRSSGTPVGSGTPGLNWTDSSGNPVKFGVDETADSIDTNESLERILKLAGRK